MELLAGNCRKRVDDDFPEDVDPFDGSDGGCDWMYGSRQSGSLRMRPHGDDDALATLAELAPPPQKLKPIRCGVKAPLEDRHPLDILAGTLDRLPEMGFLGDGCFEAPLGSKIADVEKSGQLTRGFEKVEEMELEGRLSRHGTSWDGVSRSSSVDSDSESESDSSHGVRRGKRKRKTREKMEHFLEKVVGSMMKRQEKMHKQLIKVMEKMEFERIRREEAWRKQETERMKQNEEERKQEMARSLSLITFIKTVVGEEIEIPKFCDPPKPPQNLLQHSESAQRQGETKFGYASGTRWPPEEVQALIASRSEVEEQTGTHKGAIWDVISAKMKERGYDRSPKKCKEKWENMNKYYKRVMEGGKKQRPGHSKTRSYFEQLGNLYKTNSASAEQEE
uniref:Trihelix transcription factor GT-2 n=1 Tax=Noccaea caerulescens TaxID=107243 RepID=A0A1J3H1E7_NOCCA